MRGNALVLERGLQPFDRVEVIAALGGRKPEPNRSSTGRDPIARRVRVREDFLELLLGRGRVRLEAKLKLCVRELELAVVDLADVTAGLEILDRDPQLLRQLAERFDRRRACA